MLNKRKSIKKTQKKLNTKKTIKKGDKRIVKHCHPKIGNQTTTCYSKKALLTMASQWNKKNPNNKIKFTKKISKEDLWKLIREKMSSKCNNEICWKSVIGASNTDYDVFKPIMPEEWYSNPREWLSNFDIDDVMRQYEDKHQDFEFIGPVPIDFDEELSFGHCVSDELCKINLNSLYKKGVRYIGVIFNLDKHNQSGSHWIAMFCNLKKCEVNYWDSYGINPPKEVSKLMNRIKNQSQLIPSLRNKFVININQKRHQFKGTECGVYSMMFIIRQLDGESFKEITDNIIKDDEIFKKRKELFINMETLK